MKNRPLLLVLLAAFMLALLLPGCGHKPENIPYEPDTPAPAPMNGVFVSSVGTMTFNGDDKTIILDLTDEFAQRIGLPYAQCEGTYDFTQSLPPHGRVSVRADTAHNLDIYYNDGDQVSHVYLDIGYASEDGSTYTVYIGAVTETSIPIVLSDKGTHETFVFQRQDG